jgi:TolA-binding protein
MELVQESNALRAHADKELAEAQQKLCAAERTVSSSGSMIEQLEQQLQELRDEVEYLQAELEFRGMEAEKAHKRVQLADKAAALVEHRLASLPDLDLRRLANACYHECVQLRKMLHHAEDKLHHSEVPARHTPSLSGTRLSSHLPPSATTSSHLPFTLVFSPDPTTRHHPSTVSLSLSVCVCAGSAGGGAACAGRGARIWAGSA